VYCLEQVDNGDHLAWLVVDESAAIKKQVDATEFEIPITTLTTTGRQRPLSNSDESKKVPLRFVPYFSWANRQVGEMLVWVDQQ